MGDFDKEYLREIRFYCLVMSDKYIEEQFDNISKFANVIDYRGDDVGWTIETARRENAQMLEQCIRYGAEYIFIDEEYQVDIKL